MQLLTSMKFDAVVGNPPYYEQTVGTSDKPIYHLILDRAFEISDRVSMITPARFLFNAGKTPKAWNKKVLNDEHLKVVYYSENSEKVFPVAELKGGVAITYRDANLYKVVLPKTNGTGKLGETLSSPHIVGPGNGFTQSFISMGAFKTKKEAEALLKYIKTKFARCMLGILKATQDNNRAVWHYVPIQDFTSNSDIDWTKSVAEIDDQLFAKYGLGENEVNFIKENIKPME